MKVINGYKIDETKQQGRVGRDWWEAEKYGSKFYLERLDCLKRPSDRVSDEVKKRKNEEMDWFLSEKSKVLRALDSLSSVAFVPIEIFEYEKRIYQSICWFDSVPKSLDEVAELDSTTKEQIFKIIARILMTVHNKGLVHLDVKPGNCPVAINPINNKHIATLVDFDSTYFVGNLPLYYMFASTFPYISPEFASYLMMNDKFGGMKAVTGKSDVYSLAMVFHEYWTGRKFIYNGSESTTEYRYMFEVVDKGEEIKVAPGVPKWLECLLMWMIERNPDDRPTMHEVVECLNDHSKIRDFSDDKVFVALEPKPAYEPKLPIYSHNYYPIQQKTTRTPISRPIVNNEDYERGPNFPHDAVSFDVLSTGIVKIIYDDGLKVMYNQAVAIRKGYICKSK